ncbi:MAG: WYL domain-containing protein [Succinimonas sp.]|nr:WYL domain-containing protein [Succinimonas sp.]
MPRKLDEDATTGNKLLRLLRRLMISRGRLYVSDLAEELNCSRQTVSRLVNEIESVMGNQVVSGIDNHRKWYQYQNSGRDIPGLDIDEVRILSICRDLADPYISDSLRDRLDAIIMDISVTLLGEERFDSEYRRVFEPDFRFFSKGRIDYEPFSHIITQIEHGIRHHAIMNITYKSQNSGNVRELKMIAKRFVCQNSALYVIGCSLMKDLATVEKLRSLAVHRIIGAEALRPAPDIAVPDADLGDFGLPWNDRLRAFAITFRPSGAVTYIKERSWCRGQQIKDLPDGGIELSFTSRSTPEVISWCRGFGDCITRVVIDGNEIKDIMKNDFTAF